MAASNTTYSDVMDWITNWYNKIKNFGKENKPLKYHLKYFLALSETISIPSQIKGR